MNADHILDALELIDDKYIVEAKENCHIDTASMKNTGRKIRNLRRMLALVAMVAALLALCGFAAYKLGWFDPWLQKPSANPIETVQSAIENQIDKDYTLGVRVDEIRVDDDETTRIIFMYSGSELAEARGWTDEYLAEHFVVVWAKYYVEYDHTKTFINDGYTEQYFYLTEDTETRKWTIVDNTSPSTDAATSHEMNVPLPNAVWQYQPFLSSKLLTYPFNFPCSSMEATNDDTLFGYNGHDYIAYPQSYSV